MQSVYTVHNQIYKQCQHTNVSNSNINMCTDSPAAPAVIAMGRAQDPEDSSRNNRSACKYY